MEEEETTKRIGVRSRTGLHMARKAVLCRFDSYADTPFVTGVAPGKTYDPAVELLLAISPDENTVPLRAFYASTLRLPVVPFPKRER